MRALTNRLAVGLMMTSVAKDELKKRAFVELPLQCMP
jgi:hypothetical protein